jgi:tetratricopeptide (TPR) repeat protein
MWYEKILTPRRVNQAKNTELVMKMRKIEDKAEEYRTDEEKVEFATTGGEISETGFIYYRIGRIYQTKKDYSNAIEWYKKSLPICGTPWVVDEAQKAIITCEKAGKKSP